MSDSFDDESPRTPPGTETEMTRAAAMGIRENENQENIRTTDENARTLDQFLEDAYREHSSFHQWKYWLIMLSLGISNSSDASEILCLSFILSNDQFEATMLLDSEWRGGMLAAAVFAGMLMGGLIVGTLGDWKGRRPMLLFGLSLNMTAGILSACAPNVFVLSFLRMIAGVGIGATVPPLFTLVAELAPPSERGMFMTFAASFWMVGSVFVALVAMIFLKNEGEGVTGNVWDSTETLNERGFLGFTFLPVAWRLFALTCALPSCLGAAMVYFLVPESPRFSAINQQFDEAVASANTLASALQSQRPPLRRLELEQKFAGNDATQYPSHPLDQMGAQSASTCCRTMRWIKMALADFSASVGLLYTPYMRQRTWPLMLCWFSLSFGSYGLLTWINTLFFAVHLEDVYFNALLFALSNLPGNLLTAIFMDRSGRAQMLVGSILSASLALLSFAAFANTPAYDTEPPNTYGIVISACSFQCFTTAAWNTINVMTSEVFPTTVRSTGTGVCAASGRIGAMMAQFVNGALVGRPVRLLVVASVTLAMGAMTPFLLPDHGDLTGKPVEDGFRKSADEEEQGILGRTDSDDFESFALVERKQMSGKSSQQPPSNPGLLRRGHGSYQNMLPAGEEALHSVV